MSMSDLGPDIRAAQRGDRPAAARLLRQLAPRIRNLVRYLVRGDDEVDDIAQNAMIEVLNGIGGFRGEAPFTAWADRVVARSTFRYLKRTRLRHAREQLDDAPEPTVAPSLEAEYMARRAALGALDQLPEAQRTAVALHHAAGFTIPEIAELEGVSPDTIKSRIRIGVGRLRRSLQDQECAS